MSDSIEAEAGGTVHKIRQVATDVCELEFERFAKAMDLDVDEDAMDKEDLDAFHNNKRILILAMESENLVVTDIGELMYRPKEGDDSPITFHEPKGGDLMAQDGKKDGHDVAKSFAVMAAMTRQPAKRFSGMVRRDQKVCNAILVLFFG